ncbi:MAG: hypothetical protein ACOCYU_08165, partial [Brevefilum sp.]
MPEKSPVFVGVEIIRSAGRLRQAYDFAALDANRELLAIGRGDEDEILAYLGGQQSAHVTVNAPRQPNNGVVNQSRTYQDGLPFTAPMELLNTRLCEYLLQQEGFNIESTPDKVKACPQWMRRGFHLFQCLNEFGYAPYPNEDAPRHSLETRADAVFWRFLEGKNPLPPSLEGRLQRQLILYDQELPLPDAMDFFYEITRFKLMQGDLPDQNIHSFEELNALAAALIAWLAANEPDKIELLGDPEEGQIALPNE